MRQSLMSSFSQLRLLDLHGSTLKNERPPEGVEDRNVFDIKQGVAVLLATRKPGGLVAVEHEKFWGTRETKYAWLARHTVADTPFSRLSPDSPYYFFTPQNTEGRSDYESWWKISDVMPIHSAGFITARDHFVVDRSEGALLERIAEFADLERSDEEIREKYFAGQGSEKYPDGDTRGWKLPKARQLVAGDKQWRKRAHPCSYRPFDQRYVYWADWMVDWPRPEVSGHMLAGPNVALHVCRQSVSEQWGHILVARGLIDDCYVSNKTRERGYMHPLYVYDDEEHLKFEKSEGREPNFAPSFLRALASTLDLPQQPLLPRSISAEDIFNYAYAVFYSPAYRSRYVEFLSVDFPRLPLTRNRDLFRELARLGGELVSLHLLETGRLKESGTTLIGSTTALVEKLSYSDETVWLDKKATYGFKGVRQEVWNMEIGGYQVCEKWLKDRRGGSLSRQEIQHYQSIVVALGETLRLMRQIDEVIDEHGGWPEAFVTAAGGSSK